MLSIRFDQKKIPLEIINRWRTEMRDMIDKFEHRIDQLRQNCSKLYKKNIKLKRIITNS